MHLHPRGRAASPLGAAARPRGPPRAACQPDARAAPPPGGQEGRDRREPPRQGEGRRERDERTDRREQGRGHEPPRERPHGVDPARPTSGRRGAGARREEPPGRPGAPPEGWRRRPPGEAREVFETCERRDLERPRDRLAGRGRERHPNAGEDRRGGSSPGDDRRPPVGGDRSQRRQRRVEGRGADRLGDVERPQAREGPGERHEREGRRGGPDAPPQQHRAGRERRGASGQEPGARDGHGRREESSKGIPGEHQHRIVIAWGIGVYTNF